MRLTSMVFCLLLMMVAMAGGASGAAEKNLISLHRDAGKLSNKECLACHAGIKKDEALNKKFKTLHRVHLESKKGTPKKCSECHTSVDLRQGSAAALRKQVDPQLCAGCHSGGVDGAKALFVQ